MSNIIKYKGYSARIKYSKEDNCFCGVVEGVKNALILYEGETIEEVKKDFEEAIDSYLNSCRRRNEKPEKQLKEKTKMKKTLAYHS
ncbi:MAG: toxin-antitoxin system HicB family antitoxin [Clostridia bacterium]|jgi:predicted HicB family RNase H-like nuclease|nr:toxin-antitoxin system HicB family antitoxin [Clostridia bacterium]